MASGLPVEETCQLVTGVTLIRWTYIAEKRKQEAGSSEVRILNGKAERTANGVGLHTVSMPYFTEAESTAGN